MADTPLRCEEGLINTKCKFHDYELPEDDMYPEDNGNLATIWAECPQCKRSEPGIHITYRLPGSIAFDATLLHYDTESESVTEICGSAVFTVLVCQSCIPQVQEWANYYRCIKYRISGYSDYDILTKNFPLDVHPPSNIKSAGKR